MSNEPSNEIDAILEAELPDEFTEASGTALEQRKQELIEELQAAADQLGKSPTIREFNELEKGVSADVIRYVFGSWNEAKEAAGLETRQRGTTVEINETYFEEIDSNEKAYWLGTLLARSSLNRAAEGNGHMLAIGRTVSHRHFVEGFAAAVDSEYSISEYDGNRNEQRRLHLNVTNPTFIKHLLEAGYPGVDEDLGDFPTLRSGLRPSFVRGFLESSGYFSTSGWQIRTKSRQRAESLKEWFENFGLPRVPVSEDSRGGGKLVVRVSNAFDIRTIFETCWPDVCETTPSYKPYPEKVIQHLESEYPYPENVDYLTD